jgi:serine kinase of HPr protein (carbohydrate metabolism regulator)
MIEFAIRISKITIGVLALHERTKDFCKNFLCDEGYDAFVTITQSDIDVEREQFLLLAKTENNTSKRFSDAYFETIALQRKVTEILFCNNTLLFHGSVIAVDGVAYLFTAKSGTGKSTHTRLWREMLGERAVMVNDDKPFISVSEDGITVHGSPWNGKHKLGNNISVPLRAICILERGKRNEIYKIPASKAVLMLIQQSSRPKNAEQMGKYMELLDAIASKVHFYHLSCNMDPEAAEISFAKMSKEDNKQEKIL